MKGTAPDLTEGLQSLDWSTSCGSGGLPTSWRGGYCACGKDPSISVNSCWKRQQRNGGMKAGQLSCGSGFLNKIHRQMPIPITNAAVSWDRWEAAIQRLHCRCWQVSLCTDNELKERAPTIILSHYLEELPDTTF